MKLNYKIISLFFGLFSYCQGQLLYNNSTIKNDRINGISNMTKRTTIPSLTDITCGDNTKTCNIGFGEITVKIYNAIWYISTPVATVDETFRKKTKDTDEVVSMVATIHSYNAYFDVYIHGTMSKGGCINDRNNKCTLDNFESSSSSDAHMTLNNLEDKSYKLVRFKYTDWLGKCYKTWKLYFDIQGTREDLSDWVYLSKVNLDDFY